jgi:glycosyltransferase involved in cell wall biosynthesis
MLNGLKLSLVVPTLNEAEGVRHLKTLIPGCVDEVIIVDGDSGDGTREVAAGFGWKVLLEKRRGYGRAYKTGFPACTGDVIATADGDGTYPVENLEPLVGELVARGLDFVSCARLPLAERGAMDTRNLIGNRLMTLAASVLWLHGFRDILSGMWIFRRTALEKLPLDSDNWNLSEEIKLKAYAALGPKFAELHIPYHPRLGETKLMPWKVGVENILYMLRMRAGLTGR